LHHSLYCPRKKAFLSNDKKGWPSGHPFLSLLKRKLLYLA